MKTSNHPKKEILALYFLFSFLLIQPLISQNLDAEKSKTGSSEKYTGPIIDMHLHSYSNDFWSPAPSPATGNFSGSTAKEQMEQTFQAMEENHIVLGAVFGVDISSLNDWYSFDSDRTLRGISLAEPSVFMSPDSLLQPQRMAGAGD